VLLTSPVVVLPVVLLPAVALVVLFFAGPVVVVDVVFGLTFLLVLLGLGRDETIEEALLGRLDLDHRQDHVDRLERGFRRVGYNSAGLRRRHLRRDASARARTHHSGARAHDTSAGRAHNSRSVGSVVGAHRFVAVVNAGMRIRSRHRPLLCSPPRA
jgi:hypothetical protein